MSKGWIKERGLRNYFKVFLNKGAGFISKMGAEGYYWEMLLDVDGVTRSHWDNGATDTLKEAMEVVDDTFELIGEADE